MSAFLGWGFGFGRPSTGPTIPDISSPTTRYISASGLGAGDGSSLNNAAALTQANLNTLTQAMSLVEGGKVMFLGALTTPARNAAIVSGEYPGLPGGYTINYSCILEGMKHPLNPDSSDLAYPTFCGTRFPYLLPASKGTGFDTTGLAVGELGFIVNAQNVTIRQFNARRMGTVVKQSFNGTSHGLTLEDWQVYNVQRFQDQPINIRATATATFSANPTAGESITFSGNTLTFVASVTNPDTEVLIGGTRTATLTNLRNLINDRYQALGCQAVITNTGAGIITVNANLTGASGNGTVTISRTGSTITLSGNNVSGGVTVSNNNLTIRRVTGVGGSKAFTRFAGNSSGLVLEDIYFDSGWQKNDSFARLVSAVDKASNITVTDCTCLNIYEEDNTYYNGDGYNVDDGNENVSLVNVSMSDSTDGGADFKGFAIRLPMPASQAVSGISAYGVRLRLSAERPPIRITQAPRQLSLVMARAMSSSMVISIQPLTGAPIHTRRMALIQQGHHSIAALRGLRGHTLRVTGMRRETVTRLARRPGLSSLVTLARLCGSSTAPATALQLPQV
jgi:hypothetical protein